MGKKKSKQQPRNELHERKKSQATVKSRLENKKNKKCLSSQLNLKCQNKKEKNIIKNTTIIIAFKKKIKNFEQQKIMIYIDTNTTYYYNMTTITYTTSKVDCFLRT